MADPDLPLPIVGGWVGGFAGLTGEARHLSDAGRSLRLCGASLAF